jgi:predicted ribosome quality control (RQC) complex YloA/Tae2 family protein
MPIEKIIEIPRLQTEVSYIIGKDSSENFQIIDDAKPHDLWFHVEGLASCHVIAHVDEEWSNKQLIPVVKQGAVLCKMYSKYKSVKKLPIIYTKVKNLEKTDTLGSVVTQNEKKVVI